MAHMYFEYTLVQCMPAMYQRQFDVHTSFLVVRGCTFCVEVMVQIFYHRTNHNLDCRQSKTVVRDINRDETGNRQMCIE